MWLINTESYQLSHFVDSKHIPQYAILSHTWGSEEVTFQDMKPPSEARSKKGFKKIEYCCRQARADGFAWAWVDTCCIDKTSSAELSEAINSMFAWYSDSSTCYAYLEDVDSAEDLIRRSRVPENPDDWQPPRWFTRGWTLQELIAPLHVEFYTAAWNLIGSLIEYESVIADLTGIDRGILNGSLGLDEITVSKKMSWASKRSTTRKEDEAYCLLGIFDVNMPLLYGEGEKAFQRLLNEILSKSEDQTIFLWGPQWFAEPTSGLHMSYERSCFPRSPSDYEGKVDFCTVFSESNPDMRVLSRERGIRLTAKSISLWRSKSLRKLAPSFEWGEKGNVSVMTLNCTFNPNQPKSSSDSEVMVAVLIKPWQMAGKSVVTWTLYGHWYILVPAEEVISWPTSTIYLQNTTNERNDMAGGPAVWKTSTSGYGDRCLVEQVNTNSEHIAPGCSQVQFAWGTILDQCSSLPWVLITFGSGELGGFCDVWRVPDAIQSKVIDFEQRQMLNAQHRARLLCDARIETLYATGSGPIWKKQQRDNGLWTRASCFIGQGLSLTAVVTTDMDLHLHIRRSSIPLGSRLTSEPLDGIWSYIESSALKVLWYEYEEYEELCDFSD